MYRTATRTATNIEYKDIDASEMRVSNERKGIIEGLMSKTGNIDLQDDRVIYGAWKDTLKAAYQRKASGDTYLVPFLWSHNWQDGLPPGGVFYLAETREGLFGKVQMNLEIQSGYELWQSYKSSFVSKQSIGYKTLLSDYEKIEGKTIRNLRSCELIECSAVIFPANPLASASSVKHLWPGYSFDEEAKENRVLSQRTISVLKKATAGIESHVQAVQSHLTAQRFNALAGAPVYHASSDEDYELASLLEELTAELEGKEGRMISEANMAKIGQATTGIMRHVAALKGLVSEAEAFNRRAGWGVYGSSSSDELFDTKEDPLVSELRELNASLDVPSGRTTLSKLEEMNARIGVDLALANLITSVSE